MFDIHSKIKRQVEILGLCLDNKYCNSLYTYDLAAIFGVEELTIKRDLQELRSNGIDLHSHKHKGISLSTPMSKEKICECIIYYTSIISPSTISEKATNLLTEKMGFKGLQTIVFLQSAIEQCTAARVVYNKTGQQKEVKEIKPVKIYQDESNWRLLAKDDNKFKQLLIYKIEDVTLTKNKFEKIADAEYAELFANSWKTWISEDKYEVKLQLSQYWAECISTKIYVQGQKLYKAEDGLYYFEATVNSLNEISSWILGMGKGVTVLSPALLKENIINIAKGTLSNYSV